MTSNAERVEAMMAAEARRTRFRTGVLKWARDDVGADLDTQLRLVALGDDLYDGTALTLPEIAAALAESVEESR
jgi:hypothetical protein